MKKITTSAGVFGPYRSVETLTDRYRVDGADLPFTVVGTGAVEDAQDGDFQEPTAEPAPVPTSVSMRQARLALLGAGLLSTVDDTIAAMPEPAKTAALIEWEYSSEVWRNRPFVQSMGAALGLDDAQIDALFVTAAAL